MIGLIIIMAKVVIVGHSFASRLRDFENHEPFLRLQNCNDATENVAFVGKSGGRYWYDQDTLS